MADQSRATSNAMAGNVEDGLTSLHIAVLKDDREQVRALLASREYGVDVRSSTGATPLMMASLYGRTKIFHYLVRKKALLDKADYQGCKALHYAKRPHNRVLARKYEGIAAGEPRQSGQLAIYYLLKAFERASKNAIPPQPAGTREASEMQSSDIPPTGSPTSDMVLPSTVFIRSKKGKQLELVEVRRLAVAEVDIDLGRKSTGIIREDGSERHRFAISGWAGVKGEGVLCNKEYSALVRRVCSMYGFELEGNWLDNFLTLLRNKAGLTITWKPQKWFVDGRRSRLRRIDGQPAPYNENNDSILDEIDQDGDEDGDMTDHSSATMAHEDDTATIATAKLQGHASNLSAADEVSRRARHRAGGQLRRRPSGPYRKGRSPIIEPPQYNLPRWPNLDIANRPPRRLTPEDIRRLFSYRAADSLSRETPSEWEVKRIAGSKMVDGQQVYLVKWKNFPDDDKSWEPAENLVNAQDAIDKFKQRIEVSEAVEMTEDVSLLQDGL